METATDIKRSADRELSLTRIIDRPRERVFKAWTDPNQLSQFWGPKGVTTPVCEMHLRPGGVFQMLMRGPDGAEYPYTGVFLEIVEPERLVFTDAFGEGWQPSEKPFMTAVISFEEERGKTKLTARALHWWVAEREAHERMGFHQGWGESIDRLEAYLARPSSQGRVRQHRPASAPTA
jgi:uncharacterized protein YndB with AHSA1/START domain